MRIHTCQATPFFVNCYVVTDGGEALVIDPGEVTPDILHAIDGFRVPTIVNTHGHCDHCGGNAALLKQTGAELVLHSADLPLLRSMEAQAEMFGVSVEPSPDPDRFLREGDTVTVGGVTLKVLHTPGHSPGHIVLVGDGIAFVGDVLFAGSVGRTDLPGGDTHQLLESIGRKLLTLPDATTVYPGHGPATTIGQERRTNPFLVDL